MKAQRLKILRSMAVFSGIRNEILESLLSEAENVELSAGDYFFSEGEHGGEMFVLEAGVAAAIRRWEGIDYELDRFSPGDCFGEMSLIDMCPRSATVIAVKPCRALQISNASISKIYRKDLEQFTLIQMNMGREVSRRLRHADELLFIELVEANKIFPHRPDL